MYSKLLLCVAWFGCGFGLFVVLLVVFCWNFIVGDLVLFGFVLSRLLFGVLFLMYMSPITMCLFGVFLVCCLFV